MIPVCDSGASPSGVEDPTIIVKRSILIIYIRLLIYFTIPYTKQHNEAFEKNTSLSSIIKLFPLQLYIMKSNSKQSDSDSDGYIREWRESKAKTQQVVSHELRKRTNSDLDSKKTIKYKQDPVMNSIYDKILRESQKFEELPQQTPQYRKDIYQFNPQVICGKLTNIRKCTQEQKKSFTLQDEGQCYAMNLTEQIIVVLIGKIGYTPIEDINANLYIPKHFYDFMNEKENKFAPPQRLVKLQDKFVIWIKREIRKDNSMNILDYPYLVLDPYNLLYPSYLCSWIDCKRLISLNNYIQGEKDVSEPIVFGSTCHRLLEWLAQKVVSVEQYHSRKKDVLQRLYNSMIYDMFLIQKTYEQFFQICLSRLDNLVRFYQRHILKGEQLQVQRYKRIYLKIQKMICSQYMFRSNFFGLKGKVDLLLFGQLIDRKNGKAQQVYIPMELKTGKKVSDTHKRQTQIYNILTREKYKKPVVGLLYYSDSDIKFFRYEDPLSAFQIIVVHRNQIAQNLVKLYQNGNITLPKFAIGFPQCNYCPNSAICEISSKDIEQQGNEVIEVPSKYHKQISQQVKKYSRRQIDYIAKWFKMIHLEQLFFKKINTDYWKMGISNFILSHSQLTHITSQQAKARIQLTHKCRSQQELSIFEDFYRTSMKIRMVSNALNLIQCCKVVFTSSDNTTKVFKMTVEMNNLQIQYSPGKLQFFLQHQHSIDVDIETFQNSFFSVMRNTVLNLVHNTTFLNHLLINNQNKQTIEIDSDQDKNASKQQILITEQEYQGFNDDQRKAFKKSVMQPQFCLIQGMPGTGKTELIIRLIEKFSKMNKTVLVTTFTNRALDNILQRLAESQRVEPFKIIRQGAQYACSKTLKQFTSHSQKFTTLPQYNQFYRQKTIWFVTLSSLYIHHLPKIFDITILDEASQCLQPTCIEGLLRSKKFILIGDYKQLQPVIKSKEANSKGMSLSLFERLCKLYPQNTVCLTKQYRMNNKIMTLSNKLVYDGQLQLANQTIKQKIIKLPSKWQQQIPQSFVPVICPQNSIVFLNYDPIIDSITRKYKDKQPLIRKIIEAQLSAYIFTTFVNLSIPLSSISVIAAMNSSVNKILDLLKQSRVLSDNHGAILTIDKSQGIDKEIIVLLIERGNEDLIQNPRRLNVALTRAKSKLIIIGSESHLSRMKVWNGTLGRMLKEYQIQLSKAMIEDMINVLGCF